QAAEIERDIRKQRAPDTLVKTLCGCRAVIIKGDVFDLAATFFRHFVEKKAIDRTPDPEAENAGVRMFLDLRDYFLIVAHITVGHKTNDANVHLGIRRIKSSLYRLHHFGSAAALPGLKKCLGFFQIVRSGWDRFFEQDRCVAGKCYQVK